MADTVKLTAKQQEAVAEIERNLQIIACAGAGKTEVITRRIANILQSKPNVKPENIVAFTFTEKAAESMKARIVRALHERSAADISGMYVGTIHGFCYRLLKAYTERFQNLRPLDSAKNYLFISRYHRECGMADLGLENYPCNIELFRQCIDKMVDDYEQADAWTMQQQAALEKYIRCLYAHNYIDFTLMLFEALRQIRSNPAVRGYVSQIRYLVVDEYQDINDLQEKLIRQIAEFGANICVVGDDDQTIYQFRGSNADNMISFVERYSDVHQVKLEENYRCAPGIVDIADKVISHNKRRLAKTMTSARTELISNAEAFRCEDKEAQYSEIAERIGSLHEAGIPYREMAVLVRKGKIIAPVSAALEQAGIPVESDSAEHFFAGEYCGRFVDMLQILADGVDKAKLYACWKDVAGRPEITAGFKFLRGCSESGKPRLGDILCGFCQELSFLDDAAPDAAIRKADLSAMRVILDDYDEIYGDWQLSRRISDLLKFLTTQAPEVYKQHSFREKDPTIDAVQVMTVHKAKGLEFHSVFLPELMKREFPVSARGGKKYWHVLGGPFAQNKSKYESDLEDERKLFYVAVTRAKQNLYMSYELSMQPISCFVVESADSKWLKIDRNDLDYEPKAIVDDIFPAQTISDSDNTSEAHAEWDEERRQRQAYWDEVRYARRQLYDYYGTATRFCRGAYGDLERIKKMSPDEILSEARHNRLI